MAVAVVELAVPRPEKPVQELLEVPRKEQRARHNRQHNTRRCLARRVCPLFNAGVLPGVAPFPEEYEGQVDLDIIPPKKRVCIRWCRSFAALRAIFALLFHLFFITRNRMIF